MIDGSGVAGHSYFSGNGSTGITFTFDPQRTGGLPTQAGMVWTDGQGTISFEAFDQNGASLGVSGPFDDADGSISGTTGDDRFYGVTNPGGISAIKLTNTSGGIEVDHLTLNNTVANCVVSGVTTTSTVTTTTHTTTTLVTGCAGVPSGPTFESLDCRLAALIAAVHAQSRLGKGQVKLESAVQKAKDRTDAAESACAKGDAKASRGQLKQVVRRLIGFSHRLRSNNARKKIPDEARTPLVQAADGIQGDTRKLKSTVTCPQ